MLLAKLLVLGLLSAEETRGAGPEPIAAGVRDQLRMRTSFGAGVEVSVEQYRLRPGPGLTGEVGFTNDHFAAMVRLSLATNLVSIRGNLALAVDWIVQEYLSVGVGIAALLAGVLSAYDEPL